VGLERGKEKGRKKKVKKRKWAGWEFSPREFQKISKGFPFSNRFFFKYQTNLDSIQI
jgi:hypothetical protein